MYSTHCPSYIFCCRQYGTMIYWIYFTESFCTSNSELHKYCELRAIYVAFILIGVNPLDWTSAITRSLRKLQSPHLVIRQWRRRYPCAPRCEAGPWPEASAAHTSRPSRTLWCWRRPLGSHGSPPGTSGWTRSGRRNGMWANYYSSGWTPLRRSPARAGSSAVHPPRACAAGTGHCGLLDSVET